MAIADPAQASHDAKPAAASSKLRKKRPAPECTYTGRAPTRPHFRAFSRTARPFARPSIGSAVPAIRKPIMIFPLPRQHPPASGRHTPASPYHAQKISFEQARAGFSLFIAASPKRHGVGHHCHSQRSAGYAAACARYAAGAAHPLQVAIVAKRRRRKVTPCFARQFTMIANAVWRHGARLCPLLLCPLFLCSRF